MKEATLPVDFAGEIRFCGVNERSSGHTSITDMAVRPENCDNEFMKRDLTTIEPFEICTIRPPTENWSLTFRLTRNCGWNRCLFCPVYGLGARFQRRSVEEVKQDVDRAKRINDILENVEDERHAGPMAYDVVDEVIADINRRKGTKTDPVEVTVSKKEPGSPEDYGEDVRLRWFSSWFKETPTIEDCIYHVLAWRLNGADACFLGDANSLLLPVGYFVDVVGYIKQIFPGLNRFTIYGRTRSAAKKRPDDLIAFRKAGLTRIHFGVESGSDKVLGFMRKGVTAGQHIEGCRKTCECGISCSVYVMPGLGGMKWSEEHAIETARVITESEPDYVRLRTLEIFPGTGLAQAAINGDFIEATEEQVAEEIRLLVTNIGCSTTIVSDSASNLLDVNGRLPSDRGRMLNVIDRYLSLSARDKLIFSFKSRFGSFLEQYGGVSEDVLKVLNPYLHHGAIDISGAQDGDISRITRFIRSRLMP